ncbi:MAG: hypothetical protein LBE24_01975 [Methylobacillus sp.]|jgi:hypothetical protein|nr:hypothetical protein [Methylobacillus sp.]
MAVSPDRLPFSEAVEFFKKKLQLPTSGWTDIWQEQHSHAFVVAGAANDALMEDFYNAIVKARDEGTGYPAFRQSFDEIVAKHGWAHNGAPGWRSKVIYDTNITQAYNAGRYQQMQAVKHLRPYWRYRHTSIEHPRLEHLSWDGLVLSADDPWWDTHMPQNGWGCKCRVDSLSRIEAQREWEKNGKDGPDDAPPIVWEERVVGKNGLYPRTVKTPKGIDPGFAYNPGKAWLEPHIVPPLPEHLARLVPDEWPWPAGYKPPAAPTPTVFHSSILVDESIPATTVIENFLVDFGATLTKPAVFTDMSNSALVIGAGMFIPGGVAYDPARGDTQFKMMHENKQGRKKYMSLLAVAIKDPDEIWESWESVRNEPGKKYLVRHYLKSIVIIDQNGKERFLIVVFRKSRNGWNWEGVTTYHTSKPAYFNRNRRGYLRYKK